MYNTHAYRDRHTSNIEDCTFFVLVTSIQTQKYTLRHAQRQHTLSNTHTNRRNHIHTIRRIYKLKFASKIRNSSCDLRPYCKRTPTDRICFINADSPIGPPISRKRLARSRPGHVQYPRGPVAKKIPGPSDSLARVDIGILGYWLVHTQWVIVKNAGGINKWWSTPWRNC